MSAVQKHFITGLAVLLPAALTALVFNYVLAVADGLIVNPLYEILPFELDRKLVVFLIKLLIVAGLFVFICAVGYTANHFIMKRVIRWFEKILSRLPLVRHVYSVIKEISETFFNQDRQQALLKSAVLVEYPRKGIYAVGFVTSGPLAKMGQAVGKSPLCAVFVPSPPNPATGNLVFVAEEDLIPFPHTVDEALKLVISGGTLSSGLIPPAK